MNYEPTNKKPKPKPKVIEISNHDARMSSKSKSSDEKPPQKAKSMEKPPVPRTQERRIKRKPEVSMEYNTIDRNDLVALDDIKDTQPEFQTVDYNSSTNTRNTVQFQNVSNTIASSSKARSKDITYIKNRRTGSTDCTNNKLNKREIKRISNFHKRAVVDLDTDEGEIIVSNRGNVPDRSSPSPSPVKYNIEPNKTKPFDMNYVLKSSNYESVKNKK